MITLKEGKFYKTRDGSTVGPMRKSQQAGLKYPWFGNVEGKGRSSYNDNGALYAGVFSPLDIIEEAQTELQIDRPIAPPLYFLSCRPRAQG